MKSIFAAALLFAAVYAAEDEHDHAEGEEHEHEEEMKNISLKTRFVTQVSDNNKAVVSGEYWTKAEEEGAYTFYVDLTATTVVATPLAANAWLYSTVSLQKPAAAAAPDAAARFLADAPAAETTAVAEDSRWDTFVCGQKNVNTTTEAKEPVADDMDAYFKSFPAAAPLDTFTTLATFKANFTQDTVKAGSFSAAEPSTQSAPLDKVFQTNDSIKRSFKGTADTFEFKGKDKLKAQIGSVGYASGNQVANYRWRVQTIDVTVLDSAATMAAGAAVVLATALAF